MAGITSDVGRVLWNKARSLNNVEAIKDNSLILASGVLVVSRMIIANISALKAQGTQDGPYRYREAIRTDMRETGGFTLGFLVLRAFQWGIKKGLRKGFNIVDPKSDYQLRENLKKAFERRGIESFKPDYAQTPKINFKAEGGFGKLGNLLEKMPGAKTFFGDQLKDATRKGDLFRNIYRKAPIIIGSIPTVFLAGYMLERMTRDHSEDVVDAISKRFGGDGTKKNMTAQPSPTVAPAPVPPVGGVLPQFGASRMVNPYRVTPALLAGPRL